MKTQHLTILAVIMMLAASCSTQRSARTARPESDRDRTERLVQIARFYDWEPDYQKGQDILRQLDRLPVDAAKKYDITAFREQKVAFIGHVAPAGGTNDLLTDRGYYLRIISPNGKDLRPHACWWSVIVRGTIQQVLPANRIIVLEIDENGWEILETG